MDPTLQRILSLMNEQKITAIDMEKAIGATRRAFSNWQRGKGVSYYSYIDKIADRLGVTIDYLIRGSENSLILSDVEIDVIYSFRKLSSEKQDAILENLKRESDIKSLG